MLSRPTRILSSVLAILVLAAAFAATAGAQGRDGNLGRHRSDERASAGAFGVEIVSPAAGSQVTGTVHWGVAVTGTASAKVTFAVDGSKLKTLTGTTPSIALETTRLSEGRHTLAVTATSGTHSASDQISVTVSRHPVTTGKPKKISERVPTKPETTGSSPTAPVEKPKVETPVVTTPAPPLNTEPAPPTESPITETTPPVTTPTNPITTPEAPISPSTNKILWGAWIGEQFTGAQAPWDMNAVTDFEKVAEKPLSLVNFSSPFASCPSTSSPTTSCSFYSFPKNEMESIRKHGAIPFFSWASSMLPASTNQPNFQLSDVIEGKFDSYIRSWATAAKAYGHPFYLRFNWEMNGGWFQWSQGVNGNKAGEYVAAWRHVHDIFTSVGATNVSWVWCPNVDPESKLQNLASLYPGDEYVDWTGLDGYNWGTDPEKPDKWRTFNSLFTGTYKTITEKIAPSKPMIIGEVGSTEYGGSKATWITEMLSELPTKFPKIRGFLWFEKGEEGDWPIESSTSSAKAFAAGIKSPVYTENSFSTLAASAIQPVV
jgi:Glycosyl hydrolase family 26/Bacterial Ig domain